MDFDTRPVKNLKRPKYQTRVIQPFTQEEVFALLSNAEFTRKAMVEKRANLAMKHTIAVRSKGIILLLLYTVVGVSEFTSAILENVNLEIGEGGYRKSSQARITS